MLARAVDAADFRPSRNGDGTVPAGAHSLRACQGAMAVRRGQFADLRYPATPTLAHMLTRAVDGTAFQPSRNGDGAVPAGAHSLRACQGALARRRGQFADLRYPVTPSLACFRGRSMGQLFDLGETVMGLCRLARTVCERVGERWRDGAGSLPTFGIQSYRRFAHMLARAVDAADFRPSRNGGGGCAGWRAQSARVSRSDGGTAQAVFVDCV